MWIDYYEERAILLCRLGQHEKVLRIYVRKLHDIPTAETYCSLHYQPGIYTTLFKILLVPLDGEQPLVPQAIQVLNRHGHLIHPTEAIALLPQDTKLSDFYPSLQLYIRDSQHTTNNNKILRGLAQTEQANVSDDLYHAKAHVVKMTPERACPFCHKRIGTSVFALLPSGQVVHYSCKERMSKKQ
jgi:hypothetical protein